MSESPKRVAESGTDTASHGGKLAGGGSAGHAVEIPYTRGRAEDVS
jgi:hypothetical protein